MGRNARARILVFFQPAAKRMHCPYADRPVLFIVLRGCLGFFFVSVAVGIDYSVDSFTFSQQIALSISGVWSAANSSVPSCAS